MDYGAWRSSKRCHRNFREEERQDYRGKVRKAKIFVDAEEEEEAPDDAIPAEAEGTAAAHGAAGAEDPFDGMIEGFPGSFLDRCRG